MEVNVTQKTAKHSKKLLRERTEPDLVAFYNIWPGNGAVHSYNPGARTMPTATEDVTA